MKSYSRKLGRIGKTEGGSYYVTLPVDLVRELGWRDGERITVRRAERRRWIVLESEHYEKVLGPLLRKHPKDIN